MKKIRRVASVLLAAVLMSIWAASFGEGNVEFSQPLEGTVYYPDQSNPRIIYTYSYPQLSGTSETAAMINSFYQYLLDDAVAFTIPLNADMLGDGELLAPGTIVVSAQITCSNEKYLSVCVKTDSSMGAGTSLVYAGHTFPLSGDKAGECINLPFMLGQLSYDNTDTWLEDRQTEKVNDCVRTLVWETMEDQLASGKISFYDDVSQETLAQVFFPDEDFYLDESGNPVFFIQEGTLAPVSEGALLYPFTMEELLDEI